MVYVADVKADGIVIEGGGGDSAALSAVDEAVSSSPAGAAVGKAKLVELPTCPVCLERLDTSVSGMLTTVCNHSFHCSVSGAALDGSMHHLAAFALVSLKQN